MESISDQYRMFESNNEGNNESNDESDNESIFADREARTNGSE